MKPSLYKRLSSLVKLLVSKDGRPVTRGGSALIGAFVIGAAGGCAQAPVVKEVIDPAEVSLKESLARTEKAVTSYSAASTNKYKEPVLSGPLISITYPGEASSLLERIAKANSKTFRVLGPQPHFPLFISVSVKDVPLEILLRDIAEQFGQRAQLALTDSSIEIRYKGQ